jgi:hypothetical protein
METKKSFSGYSFERFCGGFSSFGLTKFGDQRSLRPRFSICFRNSILEAKRKKHTEETLKRNNSFFYSVYQRVKAKLPKRLQNRLRLFTTLGTDLDSFFGADFVFILNNSFVTVDITAVKTDWTAGSRYVQKLKRTNRNPWAVLFCPDDCPDMWGDKEFTLAHMTILYEVEEKIASQRPLVGRRIWSNHLRKLFFRGTNVFTPIYIR